MSDKLKNELEALKSHMVTILAPAIIDMMDELGYKENFKMYFEEGQNTSHKIIRRSHLDLLVKNPDDFFRPYVGIYESQEDMVDKTHHKLLQEFKFLKEAITALSNRKNKVKESIKWIESLGTTYERKVITEKFKS
jgi:hypothetical protein